MSRDSEVRLFEKLIAREAAPPLDLLRDPGLWAGVFFDGFRPPEGEDDEDSEHQDEMRERFFGSASPPDDVEEQPLFSFSFPGGWSWHVVFHGSERGGLSHAISREGVVEPVAQLDGHGQVFSQLSFSELRRLAGAVLRESPTPASHLVPMLYGAATPEAEEEREELEAWMAEAVEKAGIVPRKESGAFAKALWLTTEDPSPPEATEAFRAFLRASLSGR